MTGRIQAISGPTVTVDLKGLKLYERVYVGHAMLTGEVVRLEKDKAVIQIYEDTRGLAVGEPVKGVGMPLTVRLGPGLLGGHVRRAPAAAGAAAQGHGALHHGRQGDLCARLYEALEIHAGPESGR